MQPRTIVFMGILRDALIIGGSNCTMGCRREGATNALRSLGTKWFSTACVWLAKAVEREPVSENRESRLNSRMGIALTFVTTKLFECNITIRHLCLMGRVCRTVFVLCLLAGHYASKHSIRRVCSRSRHDFWVGSNKASNINA